MNPDTLDRFFERAILALVLVILVFAPLAMGAIGTQEFLVVQALIMATLLLWALRVLFNPKIRLFWPPLAWPVLAFSLYAIGRYLTSDIEYVARQEMIQTLLFALLFFVIVNNLTSRESTQIVSFTMILVAAGISCVAVGQFMTHSSRVWNEFSPYPGRASGTYISPDNLACFLEMILPLSLAYLLTGRIKPLTRILLGYAALAMAAGLAVTFSRGGWVACGIGIIALLAVLAGHRKHRLSAILILAAMLAGGTIFVTTYLSRTLSYAARVEDMKKSGYGDMGYRRQMWTAAYRMWQGHFWFGVGPAHYDYRFPEYRPVSVQARPGHAHNDYLNLLADWGTTGGAIVGAGMVIFAAGLIKTWKAVSPDEREPGRGMSNRFAFLVGAGAGLLALSAHSFVDFNLHIPANAILGVALLALLTAQTRFTTAANQRPMRKLGRVLLAVALVGGIVYFSIQGCQRMQESLWLVRGQNPQLTVLDRAGLLEKAFAIDPKNPETAYEIGELYRLQSFQGNTDYEAQAKTAMEWYSKGMKLDRFDGYDYLGYGMCLDWLGEHDESEEFYHAAETLDPNNYFIVDYIGWHYIQEGDYAAARSWLERSLRLEQDTNPMGYSYWDIVTDKLVENASGGPVLPPGF